MTQAVFNIGDISYPITNLDELVSSIHEEAKRTEVLEIAKSLTPKDIHYVTEDKVLEDPIKSVLTFAKKGKHFLLEWPKGTGKTTSIYYAAQETNNPLITIQFTGHTGVDTILGKWLLRDGQTYWQDGIFTLACRYGFWIVLDEINMALPEVTAALHSALDDRRIIVLDEKDGEVVKIHPNTRIFAAINPTEDYAGTKEMNNALIDRFGGKLVLGYPNERKERMIVMWHKSVAVDDCTSTNVSAKTKEGFISRLVKVGNQIRKLREKKDVSFEFSTRNLIDWAAMCDIMDVKDAFKFTVLNKLDASDSAQKKSIQEVLNTEFANEERWVAEALRKKKTSTVEEFAEEKIFSTDL